MNDDQAMGVIERALRAREELAEKIEAMQILSPADQVRASDFRHFIPHAARAAFAEYEQRGS